jgi:D-arabinose 1-dehydrogenase-like Zn-dependent alcohol dehydrogenase
VRDRGGSDVPSGGLLRLSKSRRMRAVQITRFGGPEVLDVVDIAEPEAGLGQKRYDVSTAGVNYTDTHHALSDD